MKQNDLGLKFQRIEGDLRPMKKMMTTETDTEEILVVPPGNFTAFDSIKSRLKAVPPSKDLNNTMEKHEKIVLKGGNGNRTAKDAKKIQYGLGIDAGGTYTDAVVFDFQTNRLKCKNKALTTKWDFTQGIQSALFGLDHDILEKVELVAVSTTLATNTMVEGEGRPVGLLLMPPHDKFDIDDIDVPVKSVIGGRLRINGKVVQSVDEKEIRQVVRQMKDRQGVEAYAVSGFAGAVNPSHELEVKKIIQEETGCSVTCGHELSNLLNFKTRAKTAVINARIIPRLDKFIRELEVVLHRMGIQAPMMVVKGDGSLISADAAKERPVETILSGPAASVAGARFLTMSENAIVVDMGGTTTDTALVKEGQVEVCESGTTVEGIKTHVRALRMRTSGLGGDSAIVWKNNRFVIGPRRVAPVAWLGIHSRKLDEALGYLERNLHSFFEDAGPMQLLTTFERTETDDLTTKELGLLALLKERPYSLDELGKRSEAGHWRLLNLDRLESRGFIQYCGLTPTDLLHIKGDIRLWDDNAARKYCALLGTLSKMKSELLTDHLLDKVVVKMAVELLKKQLDEETSADELDNCHVCQALIKNLTSGVGRDYSVNITLHRPLIGIGAPAAFFVPLAGKLLGARTIVPENADVANAVGAITSKVVVRRQLKVKPTSEGFFTIEGVEGEKVFSDFDQAYSYALDELKSRVQQQGRLAGTDADEVEVFVDDSICSAIDGTRLFLGRTLTAKMAGNPHLAAIQSPHETTPV